VPDQNSAAGTGKYTQPPASRWEKTQMLGEGGRKGQVSLVSGGDASQVEKSGETARKAIDRKETAQA